MDGTTKAETGFQRVGRLTKSVCPECGQPVPASYQRDSLGVIYLRKECPTHGYFTNCIWRGRQDIEDWGGIEHDGFDLADKCPENCLNGNGLCQEHLSNSCCVMLELTSACNLHCPVCYAGSTDDSPELFWRDIKHIEEGLDYLASAAGYTNLLLSGGEPTLFPDLEKVIILARKKNYSFIQLNTNGLLLAKDKGYAVRLRQAGLSTVFLQFDSMNDDAYRIIRGDCLLNVKLRAIEHCIAAGLGVVLVPTLIRGVNTDQIKGIVDYAIANSPYVRGVHFQPCACFGRFPETAMDKLTMPELIAMLTDYQDSPFQDTDFYPCGGNHARCSLQGDFFLEEGRIKRKRRNQRPAGGCSCSGSVLKQRTFIANRWDAPFDAGAVTDAWDDVLAELHNNCFTISAKFFQDIWDIDLARLRKCTLHVLTPELLRVPFCAWNLTDAGGSKVLQRRG